MTMSMKDRKKVFAIKPERVCTGTFDAGHGRRCAVGWQSHFGINANQFNESYTKIFKLETGINESLVIQINDCKLKNNKDRAALINATLREMGYNIPKSATVGKNILQKGWTRSNNKGK